MPQARVNATRKGNTVTLRNTSRQIAFFLQLYVERNTTPSGAGGVGETFLSDNFITLLPGQQKTITIQSRWQQTAIRLSGWNIETQNIK